MAFLGLKTVNDYVKAILTELQAEHTIAVRTGEVQLAKVLEVIHRVILKVFS